MQHNVKHNVTVANRVIKVIGDPTIVRNNVNVDRLTAKFDSAWDGLDAISVFFINGNTVIRQQYSDGMPIPWEVLTETGTVLLTFKGYHGEDEIIVTRQMKAGFIVELSGVCDGGEEPSESSPTEVQQIYADIDQIREDIEAGMVKGDPGYTPIKGVDYFDGEPGYTPVKGIDYFDGEPGAPGYTPQKGIDYFDGEDGYTPVKGVDYFDGEPGQPGQDGSDYVITEDDYQEIANVVLDEIDIPEAKIFWCEYGVTTFQEIQDAITSGMVAMLRYQRGSNWYTLTCVATYPKTGHFFTGLSNVTEGIAVYCNESNTWIYNGTGYFERNTNKVTSITSASTDTQYPSAGATYRAIRAVDKELERAERRIEILEAAATGKTHIWELVNEDSSSTDVPAELTEKDGKGYADLVGIEGKTVVWNQLIEAGVRSTTDRGVEFKSYPDGRFTAKGTATEAIYRAFTLNRPINFISGHKYLVTPNKGTSETWRFYFSANYSPTGQTIRWNEIGVFTATSTISVNVLYILVYTNYTVDIDERPMCIDLTQMFGAGNEPTTVEEFRAMFPDDYYPYNPGELMSMEVAEVESRGKNLLDLSGNAKVDTTVNGIHFVYDPANGTMSAKGTATATANTWWIMKDAFKPENLGDLFIHTHATVNPTNTSLAFLSGSMNGQIGYFTPNIPNSIKKFSNINEYNAERAKLGIGAIQLYVGAGTTVDYTIQLSVERTADATDYAPYRGTMDTRTVPNVSLKSAGSVSDRLDFMAGEVVRRVGVVDLGTLYWGYTPTGTRWYANLTTLASNGSNDDVSNLVCTEYEAGTPNNTWGGIYKKDKTIAAQISGNHQLLLRDESKNDMTPEEFKASMQGVLLYYELAEPTTEPIDLPDSWMTAEANGSIRYLDADGKPVSVPHAIQFPINVNGGA